jgi:multidrug efflux pump subunit AcrB
MNLTRPALSHSRVTWLSLVFLLCAGLLVYPNLPSREDPVVNAPIAVVTALLPGMPPERMEHLVASRLEEKIRELSEVKRLTTLVQMGRVDIDVHLHDRYRDVQPVWEKVRRRVEAAKLQMPQGVQGPFVNDEFVDVSIITLALTGKDWTPAELREQARYIRNRLYAVDGIRKVDLYGERQQRLVLESRSLQSEENTVDMQAAAKAIQDQNSLLPAGQLVSGQRSLPIEVDGKLMSREDVDQIRLPSTDGRNVVPLGDLYRINDDYADPPSQLVKFNGEPAIIISASMHSHLNILELEPRLKQFISEAQQSLPLGMSLQLSTFQPETVNKAITGVKGSLYTTLFVVLLVVVLALGITEGLIVGLAVPLTMLATLLAMYILDIDLQFISLTALMVSLGMLVDNSIVVIEEVKLRIQDGKSPRKAAILAGKNLTVPLLTSTLTTVLVFIPLLLPKTPAADYNRSLSQVVTLALTISWLVALTIVPLVATRVMGRAKVASNSWETRVLPVFEQMLNYLLRRRVATLVCLLGVFLALGAGLRYVQSEMFPLSARSEVLVNLELPAGHTIEATDNAAAQLSNWLRSGPTADLVETVTSYVGTGGPRFFLALHPGKPMAHHAYLVVKAVDAKATIVLQEDIREFVRTQLPQARVRANRVARGTVPPGVVQMRFSGPDASRLFTIAGQAEDHLAAIDGTLDVFSDWENPVNRLRITIDRARATQAGVTYQDISNALQSILSGYEITHLQIQDTLIPIVLRGPAEERQFDRLLDSVKVYSSSSKRYVTLGQVAEIEEVAQFCCIARRDMERTITISGKHMSWESARLQQAWEDRMATLLKNLPPGYAVEVGGELESFTENTGPMLTWFPPFLMLMLVVLLIQFRSYRKVSIILLTIPLSMFGAGLGLLVTGSKLDFIGGLGFIALMGLIVNHGIVLLDRVTLEGAQGHGPFEALVKATLNRLRPILITSLTTILGLTPLLFMEETLFSSFAIVMIWGLGGGTLLTLFLVPVLYSLAFRIPVPAAAGKQQGSG